MLKDFNGAILDFNKAITVDPNNSLAYYDRGLCNVSLGNLDDACADLKKARALGIKTADNEDTRKIMAKVCN